MKWWPICILALVTGCAHMEAPRPVTAPPAVTREWALEKPPPVLPAASAVLELPDLAEVPTLLLAQELVLRGLTSWGCTEVGSALATWSPPTEGSPVVLYRLHVEYYGVSPDTSFVWPIPAWADSVRARVAGVDANLQQGPWSDWSLWYPIVED